MADTAEKDAWVEQAEALVAERMALYGYTPEQIEAAALVPDHYASGCALSGDFGWDCVNERGESNHPESDEYDRTAEWVVWLLERVTSPGVDQ